MKRLLSSVGIVVMFCGLAMGQEGPTVAQADPMMGQAGGGNVLIEREETRGMRVPPPGDVFYFRTHRAMRGPMGGMMGGPMHMHGPMGEWWKNPELAQRVGLSDDQTQQLDKISYESRLKMIDLRATLEKQQLMLGEMLEADQPNEDAVLGQVDKVSQARGAISRARVETMLSTRKVLTPEQWKKLKTSRMGFHRDFGHRRFGGHFMPKNPPTPRKQ